MKQLTFIILLLAPFLTLKATNYYFSSSIGSDSRTATQAQNPLTPWLTYAKLNTIFSTLLPGDSVLFKRGDTFYATATLTLSRSGSASLPINIGAYGSGARPIITSLLSLSWVNVSGNLWRSVEQVGLNSLTLVTVNGIPHEMGRWPNRTNGNNGYNIVANATTNTLTQKTGAELTGQPVIYKGATVVYRPEKFWMGKQTVTKDSANVITFSLAYKTVSPQIGFGYFIQNDSLTLDQQGEWWYNQLTKKLKIYSVGTPSNVAAATLKMFVFADSKSYVNIQDLNFNGCDSDAVKTIGGTNLKVSNCIIQNVGRNGIKTGTDNFSILSDSIVNCLSKGICIADGNGPVITYNTIRNTGQLIGHNTTNYEDGHGAHSGVGIYLVSGGDDALIEYNKIYNSAHNAIHLRKFDSAVVKYNYIDSVDNVMDDGGGIYTYEGDFSRADKGRKIIGNIILHGIGAPDGGSEKIGAGEGVAGLYFDRGSNDIEADSNFIAYFGQGTLINFGSNHLKLRYNTFYSNTLAGIQINTRLKLNDTSRSLTVTNNSVIAALTSQKTMVTFTSDSDRLNKFGTIDYNIYARPLDDNLTMSYQSGNVVKINLAGWKIHFPGYDQNSKRSPFLYTDSTNQANKTSFILNDSIAPKSIYIADSSQDINLTKYAGYTTLNRSLFLFKTGGAVAPTMYTLTVNLSGSGSVSKTPSQASYASGSTVSLVATPATGYLFSGWSGSASGTSNELSVAMSANKTITATFAAIPPARYGLTLINVGGGIATASPSASDYSSGATVTITASAAAGYSFTGWSGNASGSTNPLTITMTADKVITATYALIKYTLSTTVVGSGTISRSPDLAGYDSASTVTLEAIPADGYNFTAWSGNASGSTNPLSVTMSANKAITATFTAVPPTLYGLTLINVGNGTATASPTGPNYSSGASVTLTASPSAGYSFTQWSGDASGSTNPLTITMSSHKTITATYQPIKYTLEAGTVGGGTVVASPALVNYDTASTVTLTATPAGGYMFAGWMGDAAGTTNPLTITMNDNKTITAIFSLIVSLDQNTIYTRYRIYK